MLFKFAQRSDDPGRLAERVLSNSSGMIGACATLIGLVKVIEPRHRLTHVDQYAGLTAVAFVVAALLAHVAVRIGHTPKLQAQLETVADTIFLTAMVAVAIIGVMFAYDVI